MPIPESKYDFLPGPLASAGLDSWLTHDATSFEYICICLICEYGFSRREVPAAVKTKGACRKQVLEQSEACYAMLAVNKDNKGSEILK